MRRKIYRISEDRFDIKKPELGLPSEELALTAYEKEKFSSSFTVKSLNDVSISCNIYSSNPYIVLDEESFSGTSFDVGFHMVNDGFRAGDSVSGDFLIVYNGGEEHIPVTVNFIARDFTALDTVIKTPEDFRDFALKHPQEAVRVMFSDEFLPYAKKMGKSFYLLLLAYRKALPTEVNLDEFLIGTGLKQRAGFEIEKDYFSLDNIEEETRQSITLRKIGTGSLDIKVAADSDFVTLSKDHITEEVFVGSVYQYDIFLHPEKMHAGMNLCRITFSSILGRKEIVIVIKRPSNIAIDDFVRVKKRSYIELTRKYLLYRQREITAGTWSDESVEILDRLLSLDEKNKNFLLLMKAQALIVNKRRQEALDIISGLRHEILDNKSMEWAYLLYICTLIEREKNYVDKLTHEIEMIFREHPEDPKIFWFLLFLREDYIGNDLKKFTDIRQFMVNGVYSPYFYVEVSDLFNKDPLLLKNFDDFNIRVLLWMIRHQTVKGNLALRISTLLHEVKKFDLRIFHIVTATYRLFPSDEMLDGIVSYLLRNEIYGKMAFSWYSLSIRLGKKYTGLYEAYIFSLPENSTEKLPESVVRYFTFENAIEDSKKAYVYANVISHKNEDPLLYKEMSKSIQSFALDGMRKGRMDDNLAVIYQDTLDRGIIDEDVADSLSKMLYPMRITIKAPNIRSVIISGDIFKDPKVVPVRGKFCFTSILSNDYRIALIDDFGNMLSDRTLYEIEPLIDLSKIYDSLDSMAKGNLAFFMHDIIEYETYSDFPEGSDEVISRFLASDKISRSFKMQNYRSIVSYLRENMREEIFEKYLLQENDYDELDTGTISYIIELYVISGQFDRAFDLTMNYFAQNVGKKSLLRICQYEVGKEKDSESQKFLIMMSIYLMSKYLTEPEITAYLNQHYTGPTEAMVMLWKHADAQSLEVSELEEKILTQMLYTEVFLPEHQLIFESYLTHRNNSMLVEAYLTYFAHGYLKGEEKGSPDLFKHIEDYYFSGHRENSGMKLASIKYFSEKDSKDLTKKEIEMLDEFLGEATGKNLYFDFYRRVYEPLRMKYHLYDKYFVTYYGAPRQDLTIYYSIDDSEEKKAELTEMYDGIYVQQFILFFGQIVHYRITDEEGKELLNSSLDCQSDVENQDALRYNLINRMRNSYIYFDKDDLLRSMRKYVELSEETKDLFHLE